MNEEKSVLERKASPPFKIGLEISDPKTWSIHPNIEKAVDQILQTYRLDNQVRFYCRNSFRQIIECKYTTFENLYIFDDALFRRINLDLNEVYFIRNVWLFDWC